MNRVNAANSSSQMTRCHYPGGFFLRLKFLSERVTLPTTPHSAGGGRLARLATEAAEAAEADVIHLG